MEKVIFFTIFFANLSFAQNISSPLNNEQSQHFIDRLTIKTDIFPHFHTVHKPYTRKAMIEYALAVDTAAKKNLSSLDYADLHYLFKDNVEYLSNSTFHMDTIAQQEIKVQRLSTIKGKPFYKYLYITPANFYEFDSEYFKFKVNPLLIFKFGKSLNESELPFINQRGVEAHGSIDNKIYFYTNLIESQSRFPYYVTEAIKQYRYVPGSGFYKDYLSGFLSGKNAYDYLMASAYISFKVSKYIGVQFGHGKNFIGEGYRSLFLSDNADNYLYLKVNTNVGKWSYQNIFAEVNVDNTSFNSFDVLYGKKYFATHHLSYQICKNLQIGLFESTVFSRPNQVELKYTNPLIFSHSIEHYFGSVNHTIVGSNYKWNLFNKFSLYGQVLLDGFRLKSLFEQNNDWTNKYGLQVGLKYIDIFGVDHLDGQVEYNLVRPYTYTYYDSISNYTHRRQPLAHPLGANFSELIFKIRYQPLTKLVVEGRLIRAKIGEELYDGKSYGNDIRVLYLARPSNVAHLYQGNLTNITYLGLDVSYQLYHNVFWDLNLLIRQKNSVNLSHNQQTLYFGSGFRINMLQRRMDF